MSETQAPSLYEAIGGEPAFQRLVHRFYVEVAADPELRPVYPSRDLGPAEEHLRMFLVQYWGGPATYSEERGHPRLRRRHAPHEIDAVARAAWLTHMGRALAAMQIDELDRATLWGYLEMAATQLQNA